MLAISGPSQATTEPQRDQLALSLGETAQGRSRGGSVFRFGYSMVAAFDAPALSAMNKNARISAVNPRFRFACGHAKIRPQADCRCAARFSPSVMRPASSSAHQQSAAVIAGVDSPTRDKALDERTASRALTRRRARVKRRRPLSAAATAGSSRPRSCREAAHARERGSWG